MKTFAQYLTESEKTFDYRIKIVGDLPAEFIKELKEKLKKFDPVKIGEIKTTPVLAVPEGFPSFTNERVNIMDCSFRYPANLQQVAQMVRLLGLDENRLSLNDLHWAEGMDKELLGIENQNKDLLNTEYPAPDAEQKKLKNEAKQKEKEEKQKAKEEEKQKKIAEKLLKKKQKPEKNLILSITDVEEENVVISLQSKQDSNTENNDEGCVQIIKTGTNKGNHCGLEIFNDCLCKRHYNLKNKK